MQISDLADRVLLTIAKSELGGVYYSPDGNYLAVQGLQPDESIGLVATIVWSINADDTKLQDLTAPLQLGLPTKNIIDWVGNEQVAFSVWAGNGVQRLYTARIPSGSVHGLIKNVQDCGTMGGYYFFSPNNSYLAIDSLGSQIAWGPVNQLNDCKKITQAKFPLRQTFQAWIPDSQHFLYTEYADGDPNLGLFSSDVSLRLWDIETNDFTKLLEGVAAAVPSPDGTQVAVLKQKNSPWVYAQEKGLNVNQSAGVTSLELGVLDLAVNKVRMLGPAGYKQEENPDKTLSYWQLGRPVWSPDGKLLAYWGDDGNTYLISSDGTWRQQLTNGLDIVQFLWSPDGSKLALRTMDQAWIIENPKK